MNMKKIFIAFVFFVLVGIVYAKPVSIGKSVPYYYVPDVEYYNYTSYENIRNSFIDIDIFKDTAGYNKYYYQNGSVAIYDERIIVQYFKEQGSKWKQIGTARYTEYKELSDGYMISRFYDDFLGTTYYVDYMLRKNETLKIRVRLNNTNNISRQYRVVWELSGITQPYWQQNQNSYTFGDEIEISYQDVDDTWGDITTGLVESHAQGRKLTLSFDVGDQTNFELDPSVQIGTEINREDPFQYSSQDSFVELPNNILVGHMLSSNINITKVFISEDYGRTWNIQDIDWKSNLNSPDSDFSSAFPTTVGILGTTTNDIVLYVSKYFSASL